MLKNQKRSKKYPMTHDLALLMLLFALLLSCNSTQKKSGSETITKNQIDQVFQITLWQGGGFTGLTTGFTLSSNGAVVHWQRFGGQADTTLWKVKGYLSEVQNLKNQLEESGMLELKYTDTGNITAGIKYETQDQQHVWTWNNSGVDNDIPEPLREWYRHARDFCQSIQQKN